MIHHKAHADAVFDGDHGKVRQPAPGAEPQLGQGHKVGVIVDADRNPGAGGGGGGKGHVAVMQDRGPMHHAQRHIDKARHADADGRKLGGRDGGLGADLRQQTVDGVQKFGKTHGAGLASYCGIGNQVAREIDDDGGMFAVRQFHARHQMGLGPHPKCHRGAAARGFRLKRGGKLFDQSGLDQFGADGGHGRGRHVKLARERDARNKACGADAFKDLLAQRALRFGQRRNQRTHAFAAVLSFSAAADLRHLFCVRSKETKFCAYLATFMLQRGENRIKLVQVQLGLPNIF